MDHDSNITDRFNSAGSGSTSSSLLERVKAQDPEAWRRLCQIYGPLVYRWARVAGLQDQDAADVGQEVFRTVTARVGDFRRETPEDSFRGWLWTITRNKLGDYLRRRQSQPLPTGGTAAYDKLQQVSVPSASDSQGSDSQGSDSQGSADLDPLAGVLHRTLVLLHNEFEETTWEAFWKATVDGQPAAEIASQLGITPQAVRQAKYRVLRRLRCELKVV